MEKLYQPSIFHYINTVLIVLRGPPTPRPTTWPCLKGHFDNWGHLFSTYQTKRTVQFVINYSAQCSLKFSISIWPRYPGAPRKTRCCVTIIVMSTLCCTGSITTPLKTMFDDLTRLFAIKNWSSEAFFVCLDAAIGPVQCLFRCVATVPFQL